MKNLRRGEIADVVYHSTAKNETTYRSIIPMSTSAPIKAIDVSELSPEERLEMQHLFAEYSEYYESFVASAFNFETWVEHTKGKTISPKWRSFLQSNIKDVI